MNRRWLLKLLGLSALAPMLPKIAIAAPVAPTVQIMTAQVDPRFEMAFRYFSREVGRMLTDRVDAAVLRKADGSMEFQSSGRYLRHMPPGTDVVLLKDGHEVAYCALDSQVIPGDDVRIELKLE